MQTFIILYRQGLKGKTLGWFGQFESEELAREAFPFPVCSIEVLKVLDVTDQPLVSIFDLIENATNEDKENILERKLAEENALLFSGMTDDEQAKYIAAWEEHQRIANL